MTTTRTPATQASAPTPATADDALSEMADTLRALRILMRGARRRAAQATRLGQSAVARRFAAHARLLAKAAAAVQGELRRAFALPVAG